MNASENHKEQKQNFKQSKIHRAYLCLGSNIDPEQNMKRAVRLLDEMTNVEALSACYETAAVGSDGPNFLNMAACILTIFDPPKIKEKIVKPIEQQLGRVRTQDKNAPRTIDLDIIVYDEEVLDANLWRRVYLALPVSELVPDLIEPESGRTLRQVADSLAEKEPAVRRPEILFG